MTKRETLISIPVSIFHRRTDAKDTSDEIALAALLSWLVDTSKQGYTETKTETLASMLGWSKRKTVDVIKRLEHNGYIKIERRPPMPSRYSLPWLSHLSPPSMLHLPETQIAAPIPPLVDLQSDPQANSLHAANENISQELEQRIVKLEKAIKKHKELFLNFFKMLERILERTSSADNQTTSTPAVEQTPMVGVPLTTSTPTDVKKPGKR